MVFFGVVVMMSSSLLTRLTPTYTAKRFSAGGNTELALISVPVPVAPELEGKKVVYKVECKMKNGALECVEAG
jgi:hypothetical protein